jgi:erythritol transport system ATP-binding protein
MEARAITKRYAGTLALDSTDFRVWPGSVNVLIGENGAGKSTLVKILAGVERPTSGTLLFAGRPVAMQSARDADAHGIGFIHQELSLFPSLSVAENIFAGRNIARFGIVSKRKQEAAARELMRKLGHSIDPGEPVGNLSLGQQQLVEIARALAREIRVLIMDEPTSALSAAETEVLLRVIRELKSQGVAIVYISHRLEELLEIGDHITILRDGRVVAESERAGVNVAWIVEKMTGRVAGEIPAGLGAAANAGPVLQVNRLCVARTDRSTALDDITLEAKRGEVVGIYGLMGAGRTELFETLAGLRPATSGTTTFDGADITSKSISERIGMGLALVPEDRQRAGLVQSLSVAQNITLSSLSQLARGAYLSPETEAMHARRLACDLGIRCTSPSAPITSLSGGNQQKVVIAKCLLTSPKAILMDQPTRGVDIAAKAEICALMRGLAAHGLAVMFASSELEEIRQMADRVLVMSKGRITAEFNKAEATDEAIVAASAGNGRTGVQNGTN